MSFNKFVIYIWAISPPANTPGKWIVNTNTKSITANKKLDQSSSFCIMIVTPAKINANPVKYIQNTPHGIGTIPAIALAFKKWNSPKITIGIAYRYLPILLILKIRFFIFYELKLLIRLFFFKNK